MTFLKPRMAKARSTDEDGTEKISAVKTARSWTYSNRRIVQRGRPECVGI